MDYSRWKEYPTDHAARAYRDGFFLEAIQVLHGFIEAKLRDFLMVSRHGNIKGGYQDIWDLTQEMGFNVLARALFVSGRLTKNEYEELQRFNSLRNRVVHKFFWEPYDKDFKGVPRNEYDAAFKAGSRLIEALDFKAGEVLFRRHRRTTPRTLRRVPRRK